MQIAGACCSLALFGACGIPSSEIGSWDETNALFPVGPYLIVDKPGTAHVVVEARGNESPELEYWVEAEGADGAPKGVGALLPMRAKDSLRVAALSEIPVDKVVAYRIKSSGGTTEVQRFRTGRPPGQSFRFAAFGDTRTGHSVHRAVVEAVSRERIDFVLNSGDLVDRGGVKSQWQQFFEIERPLLQKTPLIAAIGNHDWSGRRYFRRYLLHSEWAEARRYHTLDWGNLRILTVDSGIECREGCSQFRYAERALAEGAKRGMLMAVVLHFPPYSSGKHGSDKTLRAPIADLAKKHGVELVITGHDHNYERTRSIEGTTYVVTGSAGAPIRPVAPKRFTANARTEPHYVLFEVTGSQITLRAVNLQGDVFDSAVIQENPPKP